MRIYKEFLLYCEERRKIWNEQEEEARARKRIQAEKEEHWSLLRQAIEYLKKNEKRWLERRKAEVKKMREVEKEERLAIVAQKKRRYGIKKLSKEETKRMGERTRERIELACVKDNYWKLHRG